MSARIFLFLRPTGSEFEWLRALARPLDKLMQISAFCILYSAADGLHILLGWSGWALIAGGWGERRHQQNAVAASVSFSPQPKTHKVLPPFRSNLLLNFN